MWFFLVQTLVVLAAAMGLGVVAGWVLFGGSYAQSVAVSNAAKLAASPPSEGLNVASGAHLSDQTLPDESSRESFTGPDETQFSSGSNLLDGEIWTTDRFADQHSEGKHVGVPSNQRESQHSPDEAQMDSPLAASNDELSVLRSELESRVADVARLKSKLRKAVEEIERRTAQTVAAREARDAERRRAEALEDELDENSASARDSAAMVAAAKSTEADKSALANLEVELERAKYRAGQLAVEVQELTQSQQRQNTAGESEREALTVEAASLRLRTEGALTQLNEFSREVTGFHAEQAQHLARSQQLMAELQAKITVTRSALAGRPLVAALPTVTSETAGSLSDGSALGHPHTHLALPGNELHQLPGMTPEIASLMSEIGVNSIHEVANWSSHDVARIQGWLPEYPNVVELNRWVERARGLVRSQRDPSRSLSGS